VISVVVVAIVTMALFVVLSVFNGLQGLVQGMYNTFDPDLKITAVVGKVFVPDARFTEIKKLKGVISYSEAVEEDVLLKYTDKQFIGRIKGVSKSFKETANLDKQLIFGQYVLGDTVVPYGLLGQGLSYYLSIGLESQEPVHIYVPSRLAGLMAAPDQAYKHSELFPIAIFQTQQEIDSKYIVTNIAFARKLLDYKNEVSEIELKVNPDLLSETKAEITKIVGPKYQVKDREQQHEFMFKVLKSEKWGVFLIISFILLIASFNVVGSLTMLIIDKKKDIGILKSMGAEEQLIKRIFLFEGWMISLLGAFIGLSLGVLICWLQSTYGLLTFSQSGNFIVDTYPVKMLWSDGINVLFVVAIIGFIAAYIPVRQITKS
jgi:lipoprotein-releasing system permease protein